jgi:molecular chaperone HscC
VSRFFTTADGQRTILVEVYQGEHSLCSDNQKLGEYTVTGIPRGLAGEQAVDVRFTYDLNGLLEIDTTIVSTGKTASLLIERAPGRLSREQIAAAREANARLKMHPRDALPNTAALARAEALFVELRGPRRERLGAMIAAFRAAIEAQDDAAITELRQLLLAATSGR